MPFANPGQFVTPEHLEETRKRVRDYYQNIGKLAGAIKNHDTPDGVNHRTRWLSTSKDFKPLRDLLAEKTDETHKEFAKDLMHPDTQQFVMSPEMALEVQRLVKGMLGKPEQIAALIPKVMPPYPRVCVEMPITPEVSALRVPITEQDLENGIGPLHRIGAYIEMHKIKSEDGKTDIMHFNFMPYYEFSTGKVAFSTVVLAYFDNKPIPGLMIPILMQDYGWTWNGYFSRHICDLSMRKGINLEQRLRDPDLSDAMKLSVLEAADELPSLFFMWLVLLNSKSGVDKTPVKPRLSNPGLGKRERARRSRSSFTLVTLSDTERVTPEGVVESKNLINAHHVRGHFKARKWGVYWWRPFVRGKGEPAVREAYKLTP